MERTIDRWEGRKKYWKSSLFSDWILNTPISVIRQPKNVREEWLNLSRRGSYKIIRSLFYSPVAFSCRIRNYFTLLIVTDIQLFLSSIRFLTVLFLPLSFVNCRSSTAVRCFLFVSPVLHHYHLLAQQPAAPFLWLNIAATTTAFKTPSFAPPSTALLLNDCWMVRLVGWRWWWWRGDRYLFGYCNNVLMGIFLQEAATAQCNLCHGIIIHCRA